MFGHPITIVFLTKGIAHIASVTHTRFVKTIRQEWNTQTLPKLFADIKSTAGTHPIRVLLADEFSYILELPIPPEVVNKRLHIEHQLKIHIPEVLHQNEWDFKEIRPTSKEKKVLIFAPVKYIYDALLKASEATGIHIEAIEPVQIAGRRHKNPVVGLAIKKDLKGRDEEVLNVVPARYSATTDSISSEDDTLKKSSSAKTWIMIGAVILLVGGCAYVIYTQFTKPRTTTAPIEQPTPAAQESPSPLPQEETPTQIELPLDVSSYTVRVLNGSGEAGVSTTVKKLLEEEGFTQITTGNADNFDYNTTFIKHKDTIPNQILPRLKELLSEYTVEQSEYLTTDEPYDLLIIVGKKI